MFTQDNLFGDEFMKVFAEAAGKGAFPSLRLMYLYGSQAAVKACLHTHTHGAFECFGYL